MFSWGLCGRCVGRGCVFYWRVSWVCVHSVPCALGGTVYTMLCFMRNCERGKGPSWVLVFILHLFTPDFRVRKLPEASSQRWKKAKTWLSSPPRCDPPYIYWQVSGGQYLVYGEKGGFGERWCNPHPPPLSLTSFWRRISIPIRFTEYRVTR